jgi:hypothetical protein
VVAILILFYLQNLSSTKILKVINIAVKILIFFYSPCEDCDLKKMCILLFPGLNEQGVRKKYEIFQEDGLVLVPTEIAYLSARVCCPKNKICKCDLYTAIPIANGKKYTINGNGETDVPEGIKQFICSLN